MNPDSGSALDRALAEYRQTHPEMDDLPDEAVMDLTTVRFRALGLACKDFGYSLAEAWGKQMRRSPSCPRCGEPMHKVAVPTAPGDDSWVWGHDCDPTLPVT